ncbi:MAG: translocation/assembly module TamB domain-containing protein [Bacteroidales bacterium]
MLLQLESIQTFVVKEISHKLSVSLGAPITLDRVSIAFPNKIVIYNLCVHDQGNDTLLYAPAFTAKLGGINLWDKRISFARIQADSPYIRLASDSTRTLNLQYIIDALKGKKDTIGKKLQLSFHTIRFSDAKFRLSLWNEENIEKKGIDFSDMELDSLNLLIVGMQSKGDSVSFLLREFSGVEKSGFRPLRLEGLLSFSKHFLHFKDIFINTPLSQIEAPYIFFDFDSLAQFRKGVFGQQVFMHIRIDKGNLHLKDLGYFVPSLGNIPHAVRCSGTVSGLLSDVRIKNLFVGYNRESVFAGNIDMTGLPDIRHTYINVKVNRFITSPEDVESLKLPWMKRKISLPETLHRLGKIQYQGKFTGFFDDFVTYGTLSTRLGTIRNDLIITHQGKNNLNFKGNVETGNFLLGELQEADKRTLGRIIFQFEVDGEERDNHVRASLNGSVPLLEFKNYAYTNIRLEGIFTHNAYDGSIYINDPNLAMDFLGRLDFSKETPEFDFTANIARANLYPLHLVKKDTALAVSCILTANFVGNKVNNLNGDIKLLNARFTRPGQSLLLYNMILSADRQGEKGTLMFHSDVLDASLEGAYDFGALGSSLNHIAAAFLPSLGVGGMEKANGRNNFSFRINVSNPAEVLSFFAPSLQMSENTSIEGKVNSSENLVTLQGTASHIAWKSFDFSKFSLLVQPANNTFTVLFRTDQFVFHNKIAFADVRGKLEMRNDSIYVSLQNPSTTRLNKGLLSGVASLTKKTNGRIRVRTSISPSSFEVDNEKWNIDPFSMVFDSSYFEVDGLRMYYDKEEIAASGTVSSSDSNRLVMNMKDLQARRLNLFTADKGFSFSGLINGNASMENLFSNGRFLGEFTIDSLGINGETLGNTRLQSLWNQQSKKIDLLIRSYRGNLLSLEGKGDFVPETKKIDIDLDLNKMRVNILKPYLSKVFSDLNGLVSGRLHLGGTTQSLELDGNLDVQKASFMVDYLQTRYSFTDKLAIEKNRILLNAITAYDENGNKALINGYIFGNRLKEWSINISIAARNLLCLNTTARDNSLFYGKAVATGNISISGVVPGLKMNITAKTEKGTQFNIPLNTTQEITEIPFIVFKGNTMKTKEKVDVQPPVNPQLQGMELNFELTVTPDAEAQIIFDPKIGDVIKGRGNGNIKMEINTNGKFRMYGDYVIEEGDYLFTLQNVINKRFRVERGGTISWNGDPKDANLNIKAIYPVKTSLYELLVDATEQYKRRIPIECQIFLTDKLMNPTIRYDIYLPTVEDELRNKVKNAISTQEELSKQFLSLLILNSFMPSAERSAGGMGLSSPTGLGSASVGVTGSELLSNQLSNWLSQLSRDVDIGVNYRPGDEITTQQVEVALSTQLLNDRITINGNLDVGGNEMVANNATNTSNIAGDFVVDIKLNESGTLKLKAFNRANNRILYDYAPYTQGIGISYSEEFNSFGELLKRYLRKLTGKKEEEVSLPDNVQ